MKNFLKMFFTLLLFLISIVGECVCPAAEISTKISDSIYSPTQVFLIVDNEVENYIASSNFRGFEISASSNKKESFAKGDLNKTSPQRKLLQIIFAQNYNKTLLSESHKISPYLKNEICTRAP